MSDPGPLYTELQSQFGEAVQAGWQDPPFEILQVEKSAILALAHFLKTSKQFDALMDLTAVDYQKYKSRPKPARFELVYYFFQLSGKPGQKNSGARLRVKLPVPDTDPVVASLTPLYGSADWLEREVWDMYGIRFTGHPHLRRLLMYEEFSGHPLRKDYPLLKAQPRVAQVFPGVPPFGEKPGHLKEP